jgi:hypothetical protein
MWRFVSIFYKKKRFADAMLGAGEALDCFNKKAQENDSMSGYIANMANMQRIRQNIETTDQQLEVINNISSVADKVTAYKKVFGDCCPTPQYTGGSAGCGCGNC